MKASKCTNAPKRFVTQGGEQGKPLADICCKASDRQAIYLNWKKACTELTPPEMRRLRELDEENILLEKIMATMTRGREMRQDAIALSA